MLVNPASGTDDMFLHRIRGLTALDGGQTIIGAWDFGSAWRWVLAVEWSLWHPQGIGPC